MAITVDLKLLISTQPKRWTDGSTQKLNSPERLKVGDKISLNEPGIEGEFVVDEIENGRTTPMGSNRILLYISKA
jgi:hypothetical protein